MTGFTPIDVPPDDAKHQRRCPDHPADVEPCAPVLVRLADVQPEPICWLWPGRIALGKLTLLAGDPGLGKSLLTLDLAARVSTGTPWADTQDIPNPAGGVVLLSAEDDLGDTIRPRLDAAGADVSRVNALQAVRRRPMFDPKRVGSDDPPQPVECAFDLTCDLPALEDAIEQTADCRLVVIDPITAYLGRTDSHRNAELRGLLAPLSHLAIRHRVAVVAVTHLRKSDGPAIYRSMGSLAFVAAARAVWAVTKDRDNPHRRLVLPVKNNLAADVMGMAYTIEAIGPSDAPVVAWEPDPIELSADDALAPEHGDDGATSAVDEAVNWLRDMLSAAPIPAGDVKHTADHDGIKARTLDRAKATLRVVAEREGFGKDGRWVWRLPHSAPTDPIERQPQGMAHNGGDGALCNLDAGGSA